DGLQRGRRPPEDRAQLVDGHRGCVGTERRDVGVELHPAETSGVDDRQGSALDELQCEADPRRIDTSTRELEAFDRHPPVDRESARPLVRLTTDSDEARYITTSISPGTVVLVGCRQPGASARDDPSASMAARAARTSARTSSGSSSPTDMRIVPGPIPAAASSS